MNLETKEKIYTAGEHMCPMDGYICFRNSQLMCGRLGKATLGGGNKAGLFQVQWRFFAILVALLRSIRSGWLPITVSLNPPCLHIDSLHSEEGLYNTSELTTLGISRCSFARSKVHVTCKQAEGLQRRSVTMLQVLNAEFSALVAFKPFNCDVSSKRTRLGNSFRPSAALHRSCRY